MNRLKNNLRMARKSVFYDFRAYVWFFFALLIIQTFLSTVLLSCFNRDTAVNAVNEGEFDYHLAIKNVNTDQYLLLVNDTSTLYESGKFYDIVNVIELGDDRSADLRRDVYVKFRGDVLSSYSRFSRYYSDLLRQYNPKGSWYYFKSPVLTQLEGKGSGGAAVAVFIAVSAVVCAVLLRALYTVRVNYFKFAYGIFMTYGGGFQKIYSTSFWELSLVAALAAIPSSIIAYTSARIIYSVSGFAFKSNFGAYVLSFVIAFMISAISLFAPCKRVSRRTPVDNLIADDNSNYVTSPRRSFEFFKVNIPWKYELTSIFRFRKYYAVTLLICVLFVSLFAWTVQLSDLYLESVGSSGPDCVIKFSEPAITEPESVEDGGGQLPNDEIEKEETPDYYYDDNTDRAVRSLNGIAYVHREYETAASDVLSHVVFRGGSVGEGVDSVETGDGLAVNSAIYLPVSEKELEYLSLYDVSGDLVSAISDAEKIVICDTVYNEKELDIEPGDTIRIAEFDVQRRYVDPSLTGETLLKRQIRAFDFIYHDFTVGAVIHDMPGKDAFKVFIPEQTYKEICGLEEIKYRTVEIGFEAEVSSQGSEKIEAEIESIIKYYPNATVTNNHTSASRDGELSKNVYPILRFTAFVLLAFAPLILLFSQRTFCFKRNTEFTVLEYIGKGGKTVRNILLTDAAVLGGLGAAAYLAAAALGGRLFKTVANRFMTQGGTVRFSSSADPLILMTGAAVIIAGAFISSLISYRSYAGKKGPKDKININTEFGE